jgi:hypothetical protein
LQAEEVSNQKEEEEAVKEIDTEIPAATGEAEEEEEEEEEEEDEETAGEPEKDLTESENLIASEQEPN